ncbi:MAG: hypothetical protein ACRYGI_02595 [Janthinobacterium lividum]
MMLLPWILFIVMAGGCMLQAMARERDPMLRSMLDRIGTTERSLLLVGAILCADSFFGHQNIGYRAVLLLLVVPGLLALVRVAPQAQARRVYRLTCLLVVLVLWDGVADVMLMGSWRCNWHGGGSSACRAGGRATIWPGGLVLQ